MENEESKLIVKMAEKLSSEKNTNTSNLFVENVGQKSQFAALKFIYLVLKFQQF